MTRKGPAASGRPGEDPPAAAAHTWPGGTASRPGIDDERRTEMPMVTVKLIEEVFTAEQKQEMIRKITDTMVEIEGENLRPVTWVLIEEIHSGDWGIAGNGLTTADVHARQAQPAKTSAG
jgi:4-oxalocrotonate tautomerase